MQGRLCWGELGAGFLFGLAKPNLGGFRAPKMERILRALTGGQCPHCWRCIIQAMISGVTVYRCQKRDFVGAFVLFGRRLNHARTVCMPSLRHPYEC